MHPRTVKGGGGASSKNWALSRTDISGTHSTRHTRRTPIDFDDRAIVRRAERPISGGLT